MAASQVQRNPDTDHASRSAASRIRRSLPSTFGDALHSGRQLAHANDMAVSDMSYLPTTVAAMDRLLSGGLPRGRLVELIGKRSCGRFSILLTALATATQSGESAALVDMGNGLDPRTAEALGVDLRRLLWIHPGDIKLAMLSAELALHAGLSFVAVDLGIPPVAGGRGVEAGWLRLARAANEHRAAFVVSSPYRVSGTAATAVLTTSDSRALWRHDGRQARLLTGLQSMFRIRKSRLARKSGAERSLFATPSGWILPAPDAPGLGDCDVQQRPRQHAMTS